MSPARQLLVGVMSGTSMDGADAVVAAFESEQVAVLGHHHLPYPPHLRERLFRLQAPNHNEVEESHLAALELAHHYALVVEQLLEQQGLERGGVRAVAIHGQTIRHRPELGFSVQLNAPASLSERLGIDVICDFRSRDVAAGGQGAPLVPAFHAAVFGDPFEHRAVLNLGGMANLTDLPPGSRSDQQPVRGWDTGPGNVLLDHCFRLYNLDALSDYDEAGRFAADGRVDAALLAALLGDPWFDLGPPKSTGREQFDWHWLEAHAARHAASSAAPPISSMAGTDLQATLSELTAQSVAHSLAKEIPGASRLIVCGGGVANQDLMRRLACAVESRIKRAIPVVSSETLGVLPAHVEATAFAWLGERFLRRETGSRASVTGARGARILGALYPA